MSNRLLNSSVRSPVRHGGGIFGFLVSVLLLAVLAVLGWGVFANWSQDYDSNGEPDGFTFRVLDPVWWQVAFSQAEQTRADFTAEGGTLDEIKGFLGAGDQAAPAPVTQDSAVAPATLAPTAGAAVPTAPSDLESAPETAAVDAQAKDMVSPRQQRLEGQLANYVERFDAEIDVLKGLSGQSDPAAVAQREESLARVRMVRDEVSVVLDEYALLPGAESDVISWHRQLLEYATVVAGP